MLIASALQSETCREDLLCHGPVKFRFGFALTGERVFNIVLLATEEALLVVCASVYVLVVTKDTRAGGAGMLVVDSSNGIRLMGYRCVVRMRSCHTVVSPSAAAALEMQPSAVISIEQAGAD